jgi:predicted RNA-binding Zn-ribbon protein involved in translation (DUF1610 family)
MDQPKPRGQGTLFLGSGLSRFAGHAHIVRCSERQRGVRVGETPVGFPRPQCGPSGRLRRRRRRRGGGR